MQGVALALEALEHQADALLVGAERSLDVGHFLVDHAFKFGRALHGVLDAADKLVDLAAHELRNRRQAFGGDVLRADETHGRLHQCLRDVVHLVGAVDQVAHGKEDCDRHECQQQRAHGDRQVLEAERIAQLGEGGDIEDDPDHQPDHRRGNSSPDRGRRGAAADRADRVGDDCVVLVGGHAAQHRLAAALLAHFLPAAFKGLLLCILFVGLFSRPAVAARCAARLVDFTRHNLLPRNLITDTAMLPKPEQLRLPPGNAGRLTTTPHGSKPRSGAPRRYTLIMCFRRRIAGVPPVRPTTNSNAKAMTGRRIMMF